MQREHLRTEPVCAVFQRRMPGPLIGAWRVFEAIVVQISLQINLVCAILLPWSADDRGSDSGRLKPGACRSACPVRGEQIMCSHDGEEAEQQQSRVAAHRNCASRLLEQTQ